MEQTKEKLDFKKYLIRLKDKNTRNKFIAVVVSVIVIITLIFQIASTMIANTAFLGKGNLQNSNKARKIISIPLSTPQDTKWLKTVAKNISIKGEDNHSLTALNIENSASTNSYIILCHPITGDSSTLASHAFHFYDLGFNIIMPDARGCGRSDYNSISMGVFDSKDLLKWIDYIIDKNKNANIFLFGVGMGGTTVLLSSDSKLPENVKGIISDSGYSDGKAVIKENVKKIYGISKFPNVLIASLHNKITKGWSFSDIDVRPHVEKSRLPILFIHGVEDTIVPIGQSNDMLEVSRNQNSDQVRMVAASHAQGINKSPEKYWQNIDKFIISNLEF